MGFRTVQTRYTGSFGGEKYTGIERYRYMKYYKSRSLGLARQF